MDGGSGTAKLLRPFGAIARRPGRGISGRNGWTPQRSAILRRREANSLRSISGARGPTRSLGHVPRSSSRDPWGHSRQDSRSAIDGRGQGRLRRPCVGSHRGTRPKISRPAPCSGDSLSSRSGALESQLGWRRPKRRQHAPRAVLRPAAFSRCVENAAARPLSLWSLNLAWRRSKPWFGNSGGKRTPEHRLMQRQFARARFTGHPAPTQQEPGRDRCANASHPQQCRQSKLHSIDS